MNNRSTTASEQPQVPEQIERLEKAIFRMSEVREAMDARLVNVLRPKFPETQPEPCDKRDLVPLASMLERLTAQVDAISTDLEGMVRRVEV
jgi:hypothetical protein